MAGLRQTFAGRWSGRWVVCRLVAIAPLPSSLVMVWFTNPLTVVPLLYAGWVVGSTILPPSADLQNLSYSWNGILTATTQGWPVLFTGCFALAVVTSTIGYFSVLHALDEEVLG